MKDFAEATLNALHAAREAGDRDYYKRAWSEYLAPIDQAKTRMPDAVRVATEALDVALRASLPLNNPVGPALYALIAALCEAKQ